MAGRPACCAPHDGLLYLLCGLDRPIAEAVAHALPGQVKVSAIENAYICRL
jgi:hypothetical protein